VRQGPVTVVLALHAHSVARAKQAPPRQDPDAQAFISAPVNKKPLRKSVLGCINRAKRIMLNLQGFVGYGFGPGDARPL